MEVVTGAVAQAIQFGAPGFDAIKMIALARIENRPPRLSASAEDGREDDMRGRLCGTGGMTKAPDDTMPVGTMPQVLLAHHLKQLKLPTVLREYDKVARECAQSGVDHTRYLLRLIELELIDRERRTIDRRIRPARFPAVKSFDTFDFTAIPSLNKMMVLELARSNISCAAKTSSRWATAARARPMSRSRWALQLARRASRSRSRPLRRSSASCWKPATSDAC